jgi:hypothetical protein
MIGNVDIYSPFKIIIAEIITITPSSNYTSQIIGETDLIVQNCEVRKEKFE